MMNANRNDPQGVRLNEKVRGIRAWPRATALDGTRPDVVVFNQSGQRQEYSKQKKQNYLAFGMDRA
jgi:hypothetical protein